MSTVNYQVILHKQRARQDGSYPVRLRVTYNRKRSYYTLPFNLEENIYATEEEWEKIHSPKAKGKYKDIKNKISFYETKAKEIIDEMEFLKISFTFSRFEDRFFERKKERTVEELFRTIIEEKLEQDDIKTASSYDSAIQSFLKYAKHSKRKTLYFIDVDLKFLRGYEQYMNKQGKSLNTVGVYLRNLRAAYNRAIREGYVKREDYPFNDYKIPSKKGRKRALSLEDIRKIDSYEAEPGSPKWAAKNYFLFSYLTQGMNFNDMARLKYSNIINGRIEYERGKTHRTVKEIKSFSIKINDKLSDIMEQMKTKGQHANDYIFLILQKNISEKRKVDLIQQFTKTTNKWLERIGDDLGLSLKITTYVARHTYATVLKRSGLPTSVISESLGHKTERTTQVYLDSFDHSVLDEANENLL